jgi:Glycosyl transferase 4-like domain
MKTPRIALFSDFYHEANALARTARAIEACARRRNVPLLSIHEGEETLLVHDGSIVRFDLRRSRWRFDLAMWRHTPRVAAALQWFAPDVLHFTSSGDIGRLGAQLGQRLDIPIVQAVNLDVFEAEIDAE